jgi:hypothetical protein
VSEKQTNKINARRNLLKGIAAGSGAVITGKSLPESWSRPVIDSVMLPAHAQTSGPDSFTGQGMEQASITPDSRFVKLMNGLVEDAHAVSALEALGICIKSDGVGTVSVDAIITGGTTDIMDASASNVPVPGDPVTMDLTDCNTLSGTLLDNLGLIQDAHAGANITKVEVQVFSINGNAVGEFLILYNGKERTIEFDLDPGDCTAPSCPPPV